MDGGSGTGGRAGDGGPGRRGDFVEGDGGKNGEFVILPENGSVQFWDLNSSLVIDGQSYTLVGDIKTLAADIAANPSGFYALAKPYDASADGVYHSAPISTVKFFGRFD